MPFGQLLMVRTSLRWRSQGSARGHCRLPRSAAAGVAGKEVQQRDAVRGRDACSADAGAARVSTRAGWDPAQMLGELIADHAGFDRFGAGEAIL
jgi:hypothetical protein